MQTSTNNGTSNLLVTYEPNALVSRTNKVFHFWTSDFNVYRVYF